MRAAAFCRQPRRSSRTLARLLAVCCAALALHEPARSEAQGLCYTKREVEAEATFRTAIGLREILRQCAALNMATSAMADWYAFDTEQAERIKAALDIRSKAIQRMFPGQANAERNLNDAVIANFAKQEKNEGVCKSTENVMREISKRGWSGFMRYVNLNRSLLSQEMPTCPASSGGAAK